MPSEVAAEISRILDEAEKHCGLQPMANQSEAERITRIVNTGRPVPPELYSMLHARRAEHDRIH